MNDNMEYTSNYYIDPYKLETIQKYQTERLPEILSYVSDETYRKQLLRHILLW